jgi:prepilin-type N-terminal cleavage/methylation domain-containing protein
LAQPAAAAAYPPIATSRFGALVSLMELLITMALIAVLAAIALPSFREFNIRMQAV